MGKATAHKHAELFLDPAQRGVEARAGQIGHVRAFVSTVNESERTIQFTCSTNHLDRFSEIVLPSAYADSIPAFMRNPAFPYGHQYDAANGQTPTVGHWRDMRVTESALIGTAWFKPRGLGEDVWRDFLDGNLNSVSVAFIARESEMREVEIDGVTQRVRVFTRVDLLEVSAVLIPANPHARIRAAGLARSAADDTAPHDDNEFWKRLSEVVSTAVQESIESTLEAGHGSMRGPGEDDADGLRGQWLRAGLFRRHPRRRRCARPSLGV